MREGEREVKIILLEEQWWINRFSWRGKDDDNAKFIFCAKNAREEKTMDRWKIICRPRRRLSKKVRWIGWETDRYVLEKKKKEVFFVSFFRHCFEHSLMTFFDGFQSDSSHFTAELTIFILSVLRSRMNSQWILFAILVNSS